MFPLCTLTVFHAIISDHEPIKLNLFNTAITKKQFRFKFENTWLNVISVSAYMTSWGRNFFHKFSDKVIKQKEIIEVLKSREDTDGIQFYFEEKNRLNDLILHEELYWKQRAKAFWLEEGDTNSKFYHAAASSRKKTNHISSLKADEGSVVSKHEDRSSLHLLRSLIFSPISSSSLSPYKNFEFVVNPAIFILMLLSHDSVTTRLLELLTFLISFPLFE